MPQAGQPGTSPDADHWVTIVTVTFNSAPIVAGMLESIPNGVPVILVDNASRDVPALTGLATATGASLILNRENVGFGAACNQGASKATTPYVLFRTEWATSMGAYADRPCGMARAGYWNTAISK